MRPINRTAAIVTSRAGLDNQYDIKNLHLKLGIKFWKEPRLMTDPPPQYDLTGACFGRFKVIGYLGKSRWQCKCSCGNYSSRRHKAITNQANDHDACEECRELAYLKRTRDYLTTGKNKDLKDYF